MIDFDFLFSSLNLFLFPKSYQYNNFSFSFFSFSLKAGQCDIARFFAFLWGVLFCFVSVPFLLLCHHKSES